MKKTVILSGAKKLVSLMLCVQMMVLMLCGCGQSVVSEKEAQTPIMTIDQVTVTLEDYYLYALQYVYNNSLQSSQITEASQSSFTTTVIQQMQMEYVQYQLALAQGITLTEEDLTMAESTAQSFYEHFSEEVLGRYGISYECVYAMFERTMYISALGEQARQDLADEYLVQYQEEYADLQFHSLYYALFPSIQYDENNEPVKDETGAYVALSEEEMAQQLALAEEFRDRAVEGLSTGSVTMEELVLEYGIDFCSGVEKNYSGAYVGELNDVVESLSEGEISEVVQTEAGYMIVRMDEDNDEEFKLYTLQYMASQAAQTLFPSLQENWMNASGVASTPVDYEILSTVNWADICDELASRGLNM